MNATLIAYLLGTATLSLAQLNDYAPFMQWGLGGFLVWFLVQIVVKKLDILHEGQSQVAHRLASMSRLLAMDLQERAVNPYVRECAAKEEERNKRFMETKD